jgi:AraC-like DNA-binding protein
MVFQSFKPGAPLDAFVEKFWYYEGDARPFGKERIMPDGRMGLLINLSEDQLRVYDGRRPDRMESMRGISLCGPQAESFVIDTADQGRIMGVNFKPGGAFLFFPPPADELRNAHVSLDALWGNAAGDLRERLLAARTSAERFRLTELYLTRRAANRRPTHPAVEYALSEFRRAPGRSIADVTERTGFSARRFIELFGAEVGLTPKVYCRLLRFRGALRRLHTGERIELADLAADCGYYDQAHFSNDFKLFSGFSPTAYLANRGPYINHVSLPE